MTGGNRLLGALAHVLILAAAAPRTASAALPPGFPPPRVPADNPMSAAKVALGRRLFYDPRLSGNGTQSCASCHQPDRAFTDGRAHAFGSTGETHPRSAMSLANVGYSASLTWGNPRVRTLEIQASVPMLNRHPVEMGVRGNESAVLARIRSDPDYAARFPEAFPGRGDAVTFENVRRAIASFERTIISGNSPYDRFVWSDDRSGMSDSALRGMTLFFSDRLRCSRCHAGFTLSGPAVWKGGPAVKPTFADNALGDPAKETDRGVFQVTHRPADRNRFRVPTLRNVAVTGPYMHDGRFATLGDVVDHYARGGDRRPGRSLLVAGFSMTQGEKLDLVAFLESLTDAAFLADPCLSDPGKAPTPESPGAEVPCFPESTRTKASKTRTKP